MSISLQESIRGHRDRLLQDCDWTQLADSPLNSEDKALWATYRQELRDLPEDQEIDEMEDMSTIVWPTKPE